MRAAALRFWVSRLWDLHIPRNAQVLKAHDPTQFERMSDYFDPKSRRETPTWLAVDVRFRSRFPRPLSLDALRQRPELAGMQILRRGNRLSVTPLSEAEGNLILSLGATG